VYVGGGVERGEEEGRTFLLSEAPSASPLQIKRF